MFDFVQLQIAIGVTNCKIIERNPNSFASNLTHAKSAGRPSQFRQCQNPLQILVFESFTRGTCLTERQSILLHP